MATAISGVEQQQSSATEEQPVTVTPTDQNVLGQAATEAAAAEVDFGPAIAQNLCSCYVTVHSWTGRIQTEKVDVKVKSDLGIMEKVDVDSIDIYDSAPEVPAAPAAATSEETASDADVEDATTVNGKATGRKRKKITKPCWNVNLHPVWSKFDKNEAAINAVIFRYSASDERKGDHLVSMTRIGSMLAELVKLREQRQAIADEAFALKDEILANIEKDFPDHHKQITSRMQHIFVNLRERFGVEWTFRPLTPMTAESLDLSSLNEEDKLRVIAESNAIVKQITQNQVQNLLDQVCGEVVELCKKINDGALESGRRKTGAITEMMDMLERISNFSEITYKKAGVQEQVEHAKSVLKGIDISDLNTDPAVQQAIKNAFTPLAESMKDLQELNKPGSSKASRSIRL